MTYEEYLLNKRSYQEDGEILLMTEKHACLFYKPGKGKTYPAITAMRNVAMNGKVLILSTANAINNMWNSEIVPQNILPKDTVLMTINSAILEPYKSKLMKIKWDVILVDECHKIKSHNSKISKLVHMLTKKCEYAWGLTGTPIGNSDVDIYCQFHNLNVSEWGNIPYTTFIDTTCDTEKSYYGGNQILKVIGITKKYRAGWERNISMYSQRVDYDDDDNMPLLTENPEVILPYEPSKEYNDALQGIISIEDYESTVIKLAAIQKAHQAVNGFLYYTDEKTLKRNVYRFEHNIKIDWLLKNLTNEPTVIVYRHVEDMEYIQTYFKNCTESIDDFKLGTNNILLLQCSQCESFNLQMCNKMIFYTIDYSYIKYIQMVHRIWRTGQDMDVDIKVLLFKDTIEEDIWNKVKNKKRMSDLFMNLKRSIFNG